MYEFDWRSSVEVEDGRFDYGEERFVAIGWLKGELHSVTFTCRGDIIRTISLRKSGKRDRKFYAAPRQKKKPDHIAQEDWDAVDSPPLTEAMLRNLKPTRERMPPELFEKLVRANEEWQAQHAKER